MACTACALMTWRFGRGLLGNIINKLLTSLKEFIYLPVKSKQSKSSISSKITAALFQFAFEMNANKKPLKILTTKLKTYESIYPRDH